MFGHWRCCLNFSAYCSILYSMMLKPLHRPHTARVSPVKLFNDHFLTFFFERFWYESLTYPQHTLEIGSERWGMESRFILETPWSTSGSVFQLRFTFLTLSAKLEKTLNTFRKKNIKMLWMIFNQIEKKLRNHFKWSSPVKPNLNVKCKSWSLHYRNVFFFYIWNACTDIS